MKETIKKYLFEFKNGTKTMFKEFFNKETNKKQRANMWTFSRLIISIPILIFSIISIFNLTTSLLIANSLLVAIGAVTDIFDGASARKHKSVSEYGKKLDQIVDKVFSIIVGTTLSILNPIYIIPLLGECIIATINIPFKIKHKKIDDSSSIIGKIKQFPLGLAFFLGYLSPLTSSLSLAATITVITTFIMQCATATNYLYRNIIETKKIQIKEIDNELVEIEQNEDKKYELTKSIEKHNANTNDKSPTQLIQELKELKKEILETNNTNISEEKNNNYQKRKTTNNKN